ncbi:MAG: ABC transporter permease subunit [Neomegalonema sp.]|nr:ABC transporter permease subunit [Neomegalonema sp.]
MASGKGGAWYNDRRKIGIALQILALVGVGLFIWYLISNASYNMAQRRMEMNTWFLFSEASFKVGFHPFWDFELGTSKYWEVFVIGIQNTLLVGIAGLIGATVVGFAVGVARLSDNWFVKTFASIFVELFRNVPLLLQVFFWNFVVILPSLPSVSNAIDIFGTLFITNKGIFTPIISVSENWARLVILGGLTLAIISIILFRRWAKKRFYETAKPLPVFWISVLIFIGFLLLSFAIVQSATDVSMPQQSRFRFTGGFTVPVPLFSLWIALVCYTGAFIAENVRAGILSVGKGQREAAMSLGFRHSLSMKLIQIPQALRVIIPPTISQYLNLIKNSSLAVAIGYDDIVNLFMGITLNQTGQAIVIIAMTMGVFTVISLLTSLLINIYNRSTQLVER